MVASIPKGVYTMKDRLVIINHNANSYRRKKVYGKEVLNALKKIWPLSGFASSKHLVAFIRLNADSIFSHPHIKDSMCLTVEAKSWKDLVLFHRDFILRKDVTT